mgnify:CR=1 FL=1
MTTQLLKILFVISATRINKKGLVPLVCRITYLGKRRPFTTGLFINPDNWNAQKQKAFPNNQDNNFINTQISLINQKINEAFLFLQVNRKYFDVEDIYLKYKGEVPNNEKTILQIFTIHNEKVEKLIGKDYAKPTFWKYRQSKELLKDFIKHQYKRNDYQFKDLDLRFIQEYEFYLKTEKNLGLASVNKAIQRFRKMVKIAISEGIIQREPFLMYKVKRIKKEVVFLTTEELQSLEDYTFSQSRLEIVKDMFVFCCYTGLAYTEMANLEEKHIIKGFDGNNWIKMMREKTQKEVSIPVLPKSANIIERYQNKGKNGKLLPILSNQKFNSYLKEIADIVGIEKNLTHHIARKTFATTVLLYNDVPMEIVSELLGHSKMSITQEHYGKIVQAKVSEQMITLGKKLKR